MLHCNLCSLLFLTLTVHFSLIQGEFEDNLEKCLAEVKNRKGSSFFFLDPDGWTDVSMASIRSIMLLGKTEILYTYMIAFIERFLSARNGKLQSAFRDTLEADGFYEKLENIEDLDNSNLVKHSYARNETLRLFRKRGNISYVYGFAVMPKTTVPLYYLVHLANNPSALREMKFTLWKHNTIDLMYQFQYGVYGLGFRTIDYYERQHAMQLFDFEESNTQRCIENLNDDLMQLIYSSKEGILLKDLHNNTVQMNPATWDHYQIYVRQQKEEQELEVIRNEKITRARDLKATDRIRKAKSKQYHLFPPEKKT